MMISPHELGAPRRMAFTHLFVEHLPERLEEGVLYVSVRYATAAHNCFCGCGREVVTPLHPTKWKLIFDGVSASLDPSVGSWSLDCKSHYWLDRGRIAWADTFSDDKIRAVRERDARDEHRYYAPRHAAAPVDPIVTPPAPVSRWQKVIKWWVGK